MVGRTHSTHKEKLRRLLTSHKKQYNPEEHGTASLKDWKTKMYLPRILYIQNDSFKSEGEIKTLSDKR